MVDSCSEYQHFNLFLTPDNFELGCREMLNVIRPKWVKEKIKHQVFTEGFTNLLYAFFLDDGESFSSSNKDIILFRLYGEKTEQFIDRTKELRMLKMLCYFDFSPPVYATFTNGLCYGYINGKLCEHSMLADAKYSELIAKRMAHLHSINVNDYPGNIQNNGPCIFVMIHSFLDMLPQSFDDPEIQRKFVDEIPNKETLALHVSNLEQEVTKFGDLDIAFCHNDLLYRNIIISPNEDQAYFIDFEYADFNYLAFDIANHFNEFAGMGDIVDYSLYPSKKAQMKWIRIYLEHKTFLSNNSASSTASPNGDMVISDAQVEALCNHVAVFSLASHMLWFLWALLQAKYSLLEFDFFSYALIRWKEYCKQKTSIAGL